MSEPVMAALLTISYFAGLVLWVPCLEWLSASARPAVLRQHDEDEPAPEQLEPAAVPEGQAS